MLNIHEDIMKKLEYFNQIKKIPNIIFHGQPGAGKKTLVHKFINLIYEGNKNQIDTMVMYVNAGFGKGIKFIREDLKFFAKTNINSNNGNIFKIIVISNADKLTIDAQSALRRCIELFSHNTRFFLIVEEKFKILKPILSRFCDIYIPESKYGNLYTYNNSIHFKVETFKQKRLDTLKMDFLKIKRIYDTGNKILDFSDITNKLYEKGYCGLDIFSILEKNFEKIMPSQTESTIITKNNKTKYDLLFVFSKICKEIRDEKIIMSMMLNFIYNNKDFDTMKSDILST